MKKAEDGDEVAVRLYEASGRRLNARLDIDHDYEATLPAKSLIEYPAPAIRIRSDVDRVAAMMVAEY